MTVGLLSFGISPVTFVDGHSGSPSGTAQLPTLLNGYVSRPPWNVAGVDYHVGIDRTLYPLDANLKDPSTSPPTGTSFVSSHLTVTADNVVIDGYNFNNTGINLSAHTNVTISNCKFTVGAGAFAPIFGATGGQFPLGNVIIVNNEIYGNNIPITDHLGVGLVTIAGTTTNLTFKYNYVNQTAEDTLEFENINSLVMQYNLIQDGFNTGHPDIMQGGGFNSAIVSFNTVSIGATWGTLINGLLPSFGAQGGSTMSGAVGQNNTIVALGASASIFSVNEAIPGSTTSSITLNNNYYDPTGGPAIFFVPSSPNLYGTDIVFSNNKNMVTGAFATNPTTPTPAPIGSDVLSITASPASGTVGVGSSITFTVNMDMPYTVSGIPTFTMNSGGTASYNSGSGTATLTFIYTVGGGDTAETNIAITAVNLSGGATIKDAVGNAANMSGAIKTFTGLGVI